MAKTRKELAFLRDLYINDDWTRRFTDLVDKHLSFSGEEKFLYINAGTGSHAFALRERIHGNTAIFATCEDKDVLRIAQDKATAIKSDVDFSRLIFEDDVFDTVLADASFTRPGDLNAFIEESVRVTKPGGNVAVFLWPRAALARFFRCFGRCCLMKTLGNMAPQWRN